MRTRFVIEGPSFGKSKICEKIIRSLPDWFGIEEAIRNYVIEIESLPTFVAIENGQTLGFITLKQHTPYAAEVYVMGVLPDRQCKGIGRALIDHVEAYARAQGIEYLQVKTLGPSDPDENYSKTRAFYMAMRFRPMEEYTQIWGEQNPCLILVKRI